MSQFMQNENPDLSYDNPLYTKSHDGAQFDNMGDIADPFMRDFEENI